MTVNETVGDAAARAAERAVAIRHHLHQNPELSDCEEQTSALVAARLEELGAVRIRTRVGGWGVTGEIDGAAAGPTFALRADMDALPIQEASDLQYRSRREGIMHACGHDGHTAVLLGAAEVLTKHRDRFNGTIRLIFQPAEETVGGAERMCRDGAMEGVASIVALHGWPGLDVGKIAVRHGPMMASSDTFDITVNGTGAHAAMPHASIDPILVGAHIVTGLQSLASREISPVEPVVVTVSKFHAGTAYNIIPSTASIGGTVRCLDEALRRSMPEKVERLASSIAAAFRATVAFTYRFGTGVTVNDKGVTDLIRSSAGRLLGAASVVELPNPSMGAEDFAKYLDLAPGAMFRLGVGADVTNLHTPQYNFSDAAVPVGIELLSTMALDYFARS